MAGKTDTTGGPIEPLKTVSRGAYPYLQAITSRWSDNDVYGHVNNVVYFSYFDTVVNQYLIAQGVLDFLRGEVIGLVVENTCRYFESLQFPDQVTAGLMVLHLGRSSVDLWHDTSHSSGHEARFKVRPIQIGSLGAGVPRPQARIHVQASVSDT